MNNTVIRMNCYLSYIEECRIYNPKNKYYYILQTNYSFHFIRFPEFLICEINDVWNFSNGLWNYRANSHPTHFKFTYESKFKMPVNLIKGVKSNDAILEFYM